MSEAVHHPKHYGGETAIYETIKVLEAWLSPEQFIGFCRGNAIKYLSRADKKNSADENLAKAEWYAAYERDFTARLARGDVGEMRARTMIPMTTLHVGAYEGERAP